MVNLLDEALNLVQRDIDLVGHSLPDFGEYVGNLALALACLDCSEEAIETAGEAASISNVAEVRGLTATVRSAGRHRFAVLERTGGDRRRSSPWRRTRSYAGFDR